MHRDDVAARGLLLFSRGHKDHDGMLWLGGPILGLEVDGFPARDDSQYVVFCCVLGVPGMELRLSATLSSPSGKTGRFSFPSTTVPASGIGVIWNPVSGFALDVEGLYTLRLFHDDVEIECLVVPASVAAG